MRTLVPLLRHLLTDCQAEGLGGGGEVLLLEANRLCSIFAHKAPSARQDGCSILEESGKGFTYKFVVI